MDNLTQPPWSPLSAGPPTHGHGWANLRRDVAAGLTVATVAVPQAMAYALLAGVSPVYGLYTAVVMALLGSLFGSSPYLINGPTNAISLVVFGIVAGVGAGRDDPERAGLVALLAVLVGLIQIALALTRLGGLARYVPETVILGFMAGAAVLVALTQTPVLLGLREAGTADDLVLRRLWLTYCQGGPPDWQPLAVGLVTLALVAGLDRLGTRLKVRLPDMLLSLVLVAGLVRVYGLQPEARPLHVEGGLPAPRPPRLSVERVQRVGVGAVAVAILGLTESLAIARSLAVRSGRPLDTNRQCLAEGVANLGGGLFQCLPGSGSLSRSAINYAAGGATRLSGVVAAAGVAAALWLFAPLARFVPQPTLAGILLWTAWRVVDGERLWHGLRASSTDAIVIVSTACTALFVGIEFAVPAGVFTSLLCRGRSAVRRRCRHLG
jgi:SulP family sulfate permease